MRFVSAASATLLVIATCALAQTSITRPCDAFLKNPSIYYGPDDQIVATDYFKTTPSYPVPSSVPYLKRIALMLRAQGILPVVALLPQTGIAYLGKLDAATIKGTAFEQLSQPSNLPAILVAYKETMRTFAEAGFETANLAEGLADYVKANPNDVMYYKHDAHWAPGGAKAAAYAVLKYLNEKYPELVKEIHTRDIAVGVKEVVPHTSLGGWDGVIVSKCPDYKPYVETLPILELKQAGATASSALFEDEKIDVTLIGTSFSAGAHGPGFAPYLSEALGTNVVNAGINGGGLLGAMLEWGLNLKATETPKVLIWEIPQEQINFRAGYNPLTPIMLRQIMPLLEPKPINILSKTQPLQPRITTLNLPNTGALVDFVRIKFDSFITRSFRATFITDRGAEEVDLVHSHGLTLNTFNIEMLVPTGIKQVIIETFEPGKGNVTIETNRYRR